MKTKKKVALIVLDGWGYREEIEHNAIAEAKTPFFDQIWAEYPHTLLEASGEAVGLPEGQMGNSEVGHTIIGAGKVVYTDFVKISKAAREGEFIRNEAFGKLFDHVKKNNSTLHISGLVSPGGVHSHSEHLYAFLKAAKEAGIEKIAIHAFTDGRDTPPQSAHKYLEELEQVLDDVGIGFIATTSGRFYAMDRDTNWDRLKKTEDAIFDGKAPTHQGIKPSSVIRQLHDKGIVDEHIEPIIFLDDQGNNYQIGQNDGVLFFNFRKDRARMLTQRILDRKKENNICLVTMTEYDQNYDCLVAFPPESIETSLANEISKTGLSQAHIAETEKFAHATYYLNGGKQEPHNLEKHILIDSRKDVDTHDEAPEMRAREIIDEACRFIHNNTDFIFINLANPDMVGHTGNTRALIQAIQCTDNELKRVVEYGLKNNFDFIITADHGNAEISFDKNIGQQHTAHTINPVPCIYLGSQNVKLKNGSLADITPTVLNLLKIDKPATMTGMNLLVKI